MKPGLLLLMMLTSCVAPPPLQPRIILTDPEGAHLYDVLTPAARQLKILTHCPLSTAH